jgi:hypothetical protein
MTRYRSGPCHTVVPASHEGRAADLSKSTYFGHVTSIRSRSLCRIRSQNQLGLCVATPCSCCPAAFMSLCQLRTAYHPRQPQYQCHAIIVGPSLRSSRRFQSQPVLAALQVMSTSTSKYSCLLKMSARLMRMESAGTKSLYTGTDCSNASSYSLPKQQFNCCLELGIF